jgi:hypothetical protein
MTTATKPSELTGEYVLDTTSAITSSTSRKS